ncbi:MAG: GNAT family N-acetyltransferase [Cyanobacteriota bacterium]|nr:GNAT family N-acetyltransferase [Cyanobacteriota bacterium]
MNLRRIKDGETNFLADMLYEAIFIPEGYEALPRDVIKDTSLSKYIDNWGKDSYDIALVVEVDNQLIGAIWGRLLTKENKGFGYVDDNTPELSMAVKPEYRNKGIGTELIKSIASEYQKIGVDYLSLSVDKANNALNLYKRLGYEIVKETETSWTMRNRIK